MNTKLYRAIERLRDGAGIIMLGSFAYLALVMSFDPPGFVIVRVGAAGFGAMVVLVIAFATTMMATPKSTR